MRGGELRRCAEAAVFPVKRRRELLSRAAEKLRVRARRAELFRRVQKRRDVARRFQQSAPPAAPLRRDGGEQRDEPWLPVRILARDVGRGEKWLLRGGHDDAQRPAAAAGERRAHGHIYAVYVGALLAIDLHGDIVFVQHLRHARVFKGFPLHDVTPVTGGVPYAEENGLVLAPRLFKRGFAPRIPINGIFRVLAEIGGCFVR